MSVVYDTIGSRYGRARRADPRLQRRVLDALGPSGSVINVGAGVGAYEPTDRDVVAVEPSLRMLEQRPPEAAPAVQGFAESLPFGDDAFDAGLATLTVHHWTDLEVGLRELRRVVRERVVILTWDPGHPGFWLTQDYFPDLLAHDASVFPSLSAIEAGLGPAEVSVVPVPHDCIYGFSARSGGARRCTWTPTSDRECRPSPSYRTWRRGHFDSPTTSSRALGTRATDICATYRSWIWATAYSRARCRSRADVFPRTMVATDDPSNDEAAPAERR